MKPSFVSAPDRPRAGVVGDLETAGMRPTRRYGRRSAAPAIALAALLATSIMPLTVAAHSQPTLWSPSSHANAVSTRHVASARESARAASLLPASVQSKRPNLRYPKAQATPTTTSPAPWSTVAPQIVIPDLVVPTLFDGLTQSESGNFFPADPWVAASPSFVVQTVNVAVRVSDRIGRQVLTVPESALFGVPPSQSPSDARIIWDAAHGRWVGEVLGFSDDLSSNSLILAVSEGSDPTGGWWIYQFSFGSILPDYPSVSSSSNKVVLTANLFDSSLTFLGADILVITWSSILAGGPLAVAECGAAGLVHPRAAQVLSSASDVHLISEIASNGGQLYDRITGSGACPSAYLDETNISSTIGFSEFRDPPAPRQPGPDPLDGAIDGRPTDAIWLAGKLYWVSTWPRTFDAATFNDEVVVWGLTTPMTGAPSGNGALEISAGDGFDTFFGGIGLSRNGTLFVSYSQSSASDNIAWYANRAFGGVLGTPQLLDTSDATTTQNRWGDFAGVATDPVGSGSVWATHMLVDGAGAWRTTVARLLVDADAPSNPGSATANALVSTVLTSSPNYRISWPVSSDGASGTVTYAVEESVDAGTYGAPTWLTTNSLIRALPLGHTYRFRVTAVDPLGNTSATVAGALLQPTLAQSPTSKSTGWHTSSSPSYSGGSTWYTTTNGANASYKATGVRSIGFVTTRGPSRGKFKVYIDGVLKATLSAYAATNSFRRIAYQFSWSTPGTHTIKIVVLGTAGHPRVDVDAFLVLK
jgi:hypothetical protein